MYWHFFLVLTDHQILFICPRFVYMFLANVQKIIYIHPSESKNQIEYFTWYLGVLIHNVLKSILNNFYTRKNYIIISFTKFIKNSFGQVDIDLFLLFTMPLLLQLCDPPETHRSTAHGTCRFTLHVPSLRAIFTKPMSTCETTLSLTFVANWTFHGLDKWSCSCTEDPSWSRKDNG